MCGAQLRNRKRAKDLMLMFSLSHTTDQLAITNSVHLYGHVLRREDVHVMRMALVFEAESRRKKRKLKRTWNGQLCEESMNADLSS